MFDPTGRCRGDRLSRALSCEEIYVLHSGPLHLACSGPPLRGEPLCVLDGVIDDVAELAVALGMPPAAPPERVLAAGYRRWGHALLRRLRGDFVLLIWDADHGEGLIARDQLGVRCMYLREQAGALCFASEMRDLLELLPSRPAPDPVSVAHWLAVSNRPGSHTLYSGVRRLSPGSLLVLDGHGVGERRYWEPRFAEPLDTPMSELGEHARAAIGRAVARRIDPDGGTGVLMSGGLDSSSVAALAVTQAPGRVTAYSAVFPDHPAVDESELIGQLRGTLGLAGLCAEVRPGGLVASAGQAARSSQLPLRSWGDFWATPLLAAAASAGVRTMLGGDGGDELFGARTGLLADRVREGHPFQAISLARELPGAGDHPPPRTVFRIARDFGLAGALHPTVHAVARRPLAGRSAPRWLRAQTVRDLIGSEDPLAWKRLDGPRWWASAAYALTREFEEAGVFEAYRHRATTAGLQARHPLFDLDVLDVGLRLPPLATFDRHLDRPVLRSGMKGLLPDSVRLRPRKALFDSLLVDCLLGPDRAAVRELLSDPHAAVGAYVDLDAARESLLAANASSAAPFQWMHQLWRLLTIECWLKAQSAPLREVSPVSTAASPASVRLRDAS